MVVNWYDIVWFSQCIPRHSFLVWLLMGEKLKTQDKLKKWEIRSVKNMPIVCSLCLTEVDSHDHLFFYCPFSSRVWRCVWQYSDVFQACDSLKDVVQSLLPITSKKTSGVIVAKLLFGASVYTILQERNLRLFKKISRPYDKVFDAIFSMVRLKIMSIKWKNSAQVRIMKDSWKVP
ncbi:uncharacterized protein [Rutidosis leptorrhynchoides]|uniref:uncharacterized protein n=1 Tax=Rutidosis leptorrhynchoides TaxID=125765 RepID=UPI003A9959C5